MKNKIETGDIVQVGFSNAEIILCKTAKVLYIPQATGDSWQFKNTDNGRIHYVSEGCTITLIEKGNEPF